MMTEAAFFQPHIVVKAATHSSPYAHEWYARLAILLRHQIVSVAHTYICIL